MPTRLCATPLLKIDIEGAAPAASHAACRSIVFALAFFHAALLER